MRVNENFKVSNIAFFNSCANAKTKSGIALNGISCDVFEKCYNTKHFTYSDFMNKKDKLQITEYLMLNPDDRALIYEEITDEIDEAAELSIDIAIELKNKLDKMYGADKYIFISIGTSPTMIAKAIECMGVETKYLPISSLSRTKALSKDIIKTYDFKNYFKFLKSQGISPLNAIFNPKKLVFYDYTSTDKKKSLTKFKDIMHKGYHLPKFNTDFRSLNDDIMQFDISDFDKIYFIDNYLMNSYSAEFSSIEHLNYYDIDIANFNHSSLTRHNDKQVKLFNFCIMDKLNEYGLLKEDPVNACAL